MCQARDTALTAVSPAGHSIHASEAFPHLPLEAEPFYPGHGCAAGETPHSYSQPCSLRNLNFLRLARPCCFAIAAQWMPGYPDKLIA